MNHREITTEEKKNPLQRVPHVTRNGIIKEKEEEEDDEGQGKDDE